MGYLSDMQKNIFLLVSIIIFSILLLLESFDSIWSFGWFLVIYLFFVVMPASKNLYYENGTLTQKLILSIIFILLTVDIFWSFGTISLNSVILTLFLILFLNYTSTTLQISPKYHPIVNTFSILNIIVIILAIVVFVNIIWDSYFYYDILLAYILLMGLIISSFIQYKKYEKNVNKFTEVNGNKADF